jgi:hypothetical protein
MVLGLTIVAILQSEESRSNKLSRFRVIINDAARLFLCKWALVFFNDMMFVSFPSEATSSNKKEN